METKTTGKRPRKRNPITNKKRRKCVCGKAIPSFNFPGEKKRIWCVRCKPPNAIDIINSRCECGKARATLNIPGETVGKWCVDCADTGAIDVVTKKCECGTSIPSFSLPGENIAKWCRLCPMKSVDAINIKGKRCTCGRRASFNIPGETSSKWCDSCKPANAINVKTKRCECGKAQASFNIPGESSGRWCSLCKPTNAVNVKHKRCECGRARPSFNIPGESSPRWCQSCRPINAINVADKRCECGRARPIFNIPGESSPRWCKFCPMRDINSINVKDKKCECGTSRPHFNIPGETIARWCFLCKPVNAIDVKSKRCECWKARPNFNLPGQTIGRWCKKCPNLPSDAIDVHHPKCQCGKSRPSFDIPGQSPKYCAICRKPGMVFKPLQKCSDCKNLALYGLHSRQRCEEHKQENDFNLVEEKCYSCGLLEVLDPNRKCVTCDPTRFNEHLKRKENLIRDFLHANNIPFRQDKIANNGACGKERPDFVIELEDRIIIVEVDEDQHKNYPCECEQIRMINVSQGFGGIHVFWIRYNPDAFKTNGKNVKVSNLKRKEHLLDWIKFGSTKMISENLAEVVHLFYDGCQEKTSESEIQVLC